ERQRWQQRVSELQALKSQQVAAITADGERRRVEALDYVEQQKQLEDLVEEVQSLRDDLSQVERSAASTVREAVVCLEHGFAKRLVEKAEKRQLQYE
ncbi:unnamed protein product, partial [Symbiodinium pilosum]